MRQRAIRLRLGLCFLAGLLLTVPPLLCQAAAPQPPEGLATPGQAASLPAFELPDANGGTVRSEALHGKVVVIRFWASW